MRVIGTYNSYLVALSILVASFASYTALDLGGRLGTAQGFARRMWLVAAAISMGGGIWAMHFVAMLAFVLSIPMSYDVGLTALSLVVAIIVTGVGFYVISRNRGSPLRLALSGLFMGIGIVAMHYIGMAAMRGHVDLAYEYIYVALSVLIAIGAATAALWLAFRTTDLRQKLAAALVMGLAISGMHYTGMRAAIFTAHVQADGTAQTALLDQTGLALAVAGIAFVILLFTLTVSLFDRRIARIAEKEAVLRLVIDTMPILASQVRIDGYVEYVNRGWLDYTGLDLEQASGWGWQTVIHQDDLPGLLDHRRAGMATGKPTETEARLKRFDGEYRWFLIRTAPLRDEKGKIVKWYGANIDIQDRKLAEEALRRSEAYLAEAQRLSLTGSFGWHPGRREFSWSEQTYRIFGYDLTVEPTLTLIRRRVHPDDLALVQHAIERASRHGCPIDLAHRLLMPDGSVKYVKVVAHAITNQSSDWEFVGAVTDVTAARLAEQALHKAQAELAHAARVATLGELAASIVHEVSQPLAAIVTNGGACLNWLRRDPAEQEEACAAVEAIMRDGHRASEVIRRLRELAKKGEPQKSLLEINDVINDVLLLTEGEVRSHRVEVRSELKEALPPVLGDRIQLQQVIINLIMNAIDAMASAVDQPREVVVQTELQGQDQVLVAVQDSGIGLDAVDTDRLFDAFFTTKPSGMGMGLPICRSIIEAHGGRLWASRNRTAGATFQFSLPVVQRRKMA
jgi:PAS domain S-box-containing protein